MKLKKKEQVNLLHVTDWCHVFAETVFFWPCLNYQRLSIPSPRNKKTKIESIVAHEKSRNVWLIWSVIISFPIVHYRIHRKREKNHRKLIFTLSLVLAPFRLTILFCYHRITMANSQDDICLIGITQWCHTS